MIDRQYIFMFVTKNRQKTTLLWSIREMVAFLKSKDDHRTFLTNTQEPSSKTGTHHATAKDLI